MVVSLKWALFPCTVYMCVLLTVSFSCPKGMINMESVHEVLQCVLPEVNVSLVRTTHRNGDNVVVDYSVTRNVHQFIPLTVDIYRGEEFIAAFRCENGSIPDRGTVIGEVIFEGWCGNPTVMVNSNITVSISLDLHVILSDVEQTCSTVTIGPQRLELFSQVDVESGQLAPFVRLLNVDTCNRIGPAVPIRLSTSTNASIVLHPDGSNEAVGDISVWPLPCSDSHTQEYGVSVSSADSFTLYGEIVNALLPIKCIFVPVSASGADALPLTLYIVLSIVAFVIIVIIGIVCGGLALAFLCRKYTREYGVHDIQDSEPPEFRPEAAFAETTTPASETQKKPVIRYVRDSQYDVQRQTRSGSAELDCRDSRSWTGSSSTRHTQTVVREVDLQTAV